MRSTAAPNTRSTLDPEQARLGDDGDSGGTTSGDTAGCTAATGELRSDRGGPDGLRLVGRSPAFTHIRDLAEAIAPRKCTVLVLGETGTGKEMLAMMIHAKSPRAAAPFVPVDCSALTDTLVESQLFGHAKGAFTGAVRDSLGFIRAADGGTLFLDEVGELPLTLQAKLLRVIQERAVVPVGETKPRPVDVRIICATHRDLGEMVAEGSFREDLFFRLNVVTLHLPPLRERPGDVLALARHFLQQQARAYDETPRQIAPDAAEVLQRYPWPGNVRELANAIEHAHVLCRTHQITAADLPERMRTVTAGAGSRASVGSRQAAGSSAPGRTPIDKPATITTDFTDGELRLSVVERRTIAEALRRTHGNKAAAARLLGINIQRLGRRITALKVELPA